MSTQTEYDIIYTVRRRESEDDDFEEIGFGASGTWGTPQEAIEVIAAYVEHYNWETDDTMPDPEEIRGDIEGTEA